MQLILTGATGTAGSEVLRQALLDARITGITVLTRRPLPPHVAPSSPSQKLRIIEHADFASYPPSLLSQLKGHDACIWALGRSSVGMKEDEYDKITVSYALEAAEAFSGLERETKEGREKFVFAFVSGMGADQQEGKASQMFGRLKGKAERLLAQLPAEGYPSLAPFSFRPGGILPIAPVSEAPWFYRPPLLSIMRALGLIWPAGVIKTDELAKGLIEACLQGGKGKIEGWPGKGEVGNDGVFGNVEIKRLASAQKAH
ncbi:hypothetical protein JCM10213_002763 [Rhodosporidiobolus nylandii]